MSSLEAGRLCRLAGSALRPAGGVGPAASTSLALSSLEAGRLCRLAGSALRPAGGVGPAASTSLAMSSLEARRLCRLAGSALRPADGVGGPEGKLRGRPPPPVEPRSGPWRRTGSEFDAGRAQTRRDVSMTERPRLAQASWTCRYLFIRSDVEKRFVREVFRAARTVTRTE